MGGAQTWGAPEESLARSSQIWQGPRKGAAVVSFRIAPAVRRPSENWRRPGGKSSAAMRGRGGTGGTRAETPLRALRVPRAKRGIGRRAGDSMGTPGRRGGSFISAPHSSVRLLPAPRAEPAALPRRAYLPPQNPPARPCLPSAPRLASFLLPARSLRPALSGVTPFGSVQRGFCEVSGEGESPPLLLQSWRLSPPIPPPVSLGVREAVPSSAFVAPHL